MSDALSILFVSAMAVVMGVTYLVAALHSWVDMRRCEREEREVYDAEDRAYRAGDGPPPAPLSTWTWE